MAEVTGLDTALYRRLITLAVACVLGAAVFVVTTAQASRAAQTTTPSGRAAPEAATGSGPAPDPKPTKVPKPDPSPRQPVRAAPPPAAPPPPVVPDSTQPTEPATQAPTPTTPAVQATPPPARATPPPPVRATRPPPPPVVRRPSTTRRTSAPVARLTAARMEAKRARVDRESTEFAAGSAAAARLSETSSPTGSGPVLIFAAFVAFGLLLLGSSAVPARRVPWTFISEPLLLHRSDLAALGIGAIAVGFLLLNIAVMV